MLATLQKKLSQVEPILKAQAGVVEETVYGVVDKINDDGTPHFIRKWKGTIGNMRPTDEEPTVFVIEKLEPLIIKHKKWKLVFGGRAGTKSIMVMDALSGDVNANGSKVFALRERMKSLRESIYSGIEGRIKALKFGGFRSVPSNWEINHVNGGKISFGGMQNIIDMKGTFEYKYFLMEEAARTKQQTLDTLGPTLRGIADAEIWGVWNPESANDPMSLEFIIPYQAALDRDGYYEDDYHMIIKVGFEDNPWFMHDQSLREESKKTCKRNRTAGCQRLDLGIFGTGHLMMISRTASLKRTGLTRALMHIRNWASRLKAVALAALTRPMLAGMQKATVYVKVWCLLMCVSWMQRMRIEPLILLHVTLRMRVLIHLAGIATAWVLCCVTKQAGISMAQKFTRLCIKARNLRTSQKQYLKAKAITVSATTKRIKTYLTTRKRKT